MLARCGRAAHICEANCILQQVFSDAIAFFKTCQFAIDYLYNVSYKFGQGNGAIAARWQAKAGVEPPFAGCERPGSLRVLFHVKQLKHLLQLFPRNSCKITDYC